MARFRPLSPTLAICDAAEIVVRRLPPNKPPNSPGLAQCLVSAVLFDVMRKRLFASLSCHMLDMEVIDNHVIKLIQHVAHEYIKIRLHHMGKSYTESIAGKKVRPTLAKLILFNHQ